MLKGQYCRLQIFVIFLVSKVVSVKSEKRDGCSINCVDEQKNLTTRRWMLLCLAAVAVMVLGKRVGQYGQWAVHLQPLPPLDSFDKFQPGRSKKIGRDKFWS